MTDKSNDSLVTSGDDSELFEAARRAQTLLRYCQRRLDRLEDLLDQQDVRLAALDKLQASLKNHPAAQNAWDNFAVILRLVDPDSIHYIDKLK